MPDSAIASMSIPHGPNAMANSDRPNPASYAMARVGWLLFAAQPVQCPLVTQHDERVVVDG
jgi:hypothetical protein